MFCIWTPPSWKTASQHTVGPMPCCRQPLPNFQWQQAVSRCSIKICCYNSGSCCSDWHVRSNRQHISTIKNLVIYKYVSRTKIVLDQFFARSTDISCSRCFSSCALRIFSASICRLFSRYCMPSQSAFDRTVTFWRFIPPEPSFVGDLTSAGSSVPEKVICTK